jgi:hypothetical protein
MKRALFTGHFDLPLLVELPGIELQERRISLRETTQKYAKRDLRIRERC